MPGDRQTSCGIAVPLALAPSSGDRAFGWYSMGLLVGIALYLSLSLVRER